MASQKFQRLICFLAVMLALGSLASCGQGRDGDISIAWIGSEESLFSSGVRLGPDAQHLRTAVDAGLVSLDARGEVVPALAERWIINDDGLSFIFRLREEQWPDGSEMSSESVRRVIRRTIRKLKGTSLGLDLAPIEEIRARTGRVIEIRLSSPVPDLLQLLAQPELVLRTSGGGTGSMVFDRAENTILLEFRPPAERGLPEMPDWKSEVRGVKLTVLDARGALSQFENGEVDAVFGGRLSDFLLADTGPLSRGTVRVDPVLGLFGLLVRNPSGPLGDVGTREALSMAIDRDQLLAPLNLGGWSTTTRIIASGNGEAGTLGPERWADLAIEERRSIAAGRVRANLASDPSGSVLVKILLDQTVGQDLLYRSLASQFATIGVRLEKVDVQSEADLVLVDTIARSGHPSWYLNQLNCSLARGLCDENADLLVREAQASKDAAERHAKYAAAEESLLQSNVYIPIGAPLRWSLLRGSVEGFEPNVFGFHPLPYLAQIPK